MKKNTTWLLPILSTCILIGGVNSCYRENKNSNQFSTIDSESRDENVSTYYGGHVRIEISFTGSHCNVTRTFLGSNVNNPAILYNLTSILPANSKLTFNESNIYWFVPFDMNVNAQVIGGEVSCVASNDCNDCELINDSNHPGCLVCNCKEGQSTGPSPDCDMKPQNVANGGVFIQAESLQITDNL